jgi:hypothetical protein
MVSMQQTRFVVATILALELAVLLAACSGSSGGITPSGVAPGSEMRLPWNVVPEQTYKPITVKGHPEWTLRFGYVRAPNGYSRPKGNGTCSSIQLSLPSWIGSFKDRSSTYCFQMIGKAPKATAPSTTLTTQVYAYKLTFSNGEVFDPTAIKKTCDSVSPYTRLVDSPLYKAVPMVNGKVKLGTIEYEDAQSLGEWYKLVKTDKSYAVNLHNAGKPVVVDLSVPASEGHTETLSGFCNESGYGVVNQAWLQSQLNMAQWSVKQISVVLLWNVVEQGQSSQCCIVGWHTAYTNSEGQNGVYALVGFFDSGIFNIPGIADINDAAHEFGETINDPFVNNIVPPWGHVGQFPNTCSNLLEVGDPLSGTVYGNGAGIVLKGFTYHPQELAYFNWFTQQKAYGEYGADDVYSMSGTFTAPATLCS